MAKEKELSMGGLMKKIAYIGAHSSAKTTTVNRLSQFLKDYNIPYVVVTEVPRDCPFDINQESGYKAQSWMVTEQVKRELEAQNKGSLNGYIICDRSLWDYVAYSRSLHEKELMTNDELIILTNTVRGLVEVMKPYDTIYFCEMKALYADGVRDTDPEWQKEVYKHFKGVIKDYSLKVTVVQ